jgi:hypothetical protein
MGMADAFGAWTTDVVRVVGEVVDETCVLEDAPVVVVDVEFAIESCLILPFSTCKKY